MARERKRFARPDLGSFHATDVIVGGRYTPSRARLAVPERAQFHQGTTRLLSLSGILRHQALEQTRVLYGGSQHLIINWLCPHERARTERGTHSCAYCAP